MPDVTSEPTTWRERAVERSTRAAKQRAEQRVQRFLDAAQELMEEKGTTEFTIQEIVERTKHSLRSFYEHFDGKHELLLALLEDALARHTEAIRDEIADRADPMDRLRRGVELLYSVCLPHTEIRRPLFNDFALQLLVSHPAEVALAHGPLLTLFTELIADAVPIERPRRRATLVMQTVMFTAQANGVPTAGSQAVTADEVWQFCLGGITGTGQG